MMDSFDRQFARLRENYLSALKTRDPESIHDYRVAVKRLRALFNLVETVNPGFDARKHLRRFRAVFKSSAEFRDLHIQADLAGEFSALSGFPGDEYLAFIRKRERKAAANMSEFGVDFDLERLGKKRKKIARALEGTDPDSAERSMRYRFESLRGELAFRIEGHEPEDRDLHAVRILVKEYHYTGEILRECFPACLVDGDTVFAGLKRVHQALGKWHDYEVARAWLKRYGKKHLSFAESGGIEAERYIGEKKGELREDFLRAWGEFRSIFPIGPATAEKNA